MVWSKDAFEGAMAKFEGILGPALQRIVDARSLTNEAKPGDDPIQVKEA
jgi:hypothetical protein